MPTFFARRYMRDTVPRTEIAVGVVVLLLTAGIVAAFVASLRPAERKLFDVEAKHLIAPPSHEAMAAAELMPALPPAWRMVDAPAAQRADAATGWFGKDPADVLAFDPVWAYRGQFESTDGSGASAVVIVLDMQTPRNAFGVSGARKPVEATTVALGCGGWSAGPRVGFWSGRYYTEVEAGGARAGETAVWVAQAAAARQLVYGRPFSAEALLPDDGRRHDSFRYVRTGAAGVDFLNDAFLVDYENGSTAFVVEAPDPGTAEKTLASFRERFSAAGTAVAVPDEIGERGAAGRIGERHWLVVRSGLHVFGATGPSPQTVQSVVLTAERRLGVSSISGPVATAGAPPPARGGRFPEVPSAGLPAPTDIRRFNRDNLYEKINGKAGVFLGFLFEELEFATYVSATKGWQFDAYVFNMGQPVNAFGIFQVEQAHDAEPLAAGRQGYLSGASAFFWKDKFYVNVLGPPDEPAAAEMAKAIAAAMDAAIADRGEPFWAETVLPQEGRRPGSLSYKATDALGYSFLKQVFVADYEVGGAKFQLFIHRAADAAAAKSLFDRFVENAKQFGKVVGGEEHAGGAYVVSESLGVFEAGVHVGPYFGGVTECGSRDVAAEQAKAFLERLAAAPVSEAAAPASTPAAPDGEKAASPADAEGGYGEQG